MRESDRGGTAPSTRQVGVVLALIVVAAVAVFSLGVMVGKQGPAPESGLSPPPATLPTENLPKSAGGSGAGDAGTPMAEGGASSAKNSSEKLTFFDALSAEKAVKPNVAPPPPPPPKIVTPAVPRKKAKAPPPRTTVPPTPRKWSDRVNDLRSAGEYHLQVSSSTKKSWAEDLVKKLKKQGIEARMKVVTVKGKKRFRIRVGPFADTSAANKAKAIFKKEMNIDGMVVSGD